jgi:hypothetical protein
MKFFCNVSRLSYLLLLCFCFGTYGCNRPDDRDAKILADANGSSSQKNPVHSISIPEAGHGGRLLCNNTNIIYWTDGTRFRPSSEIDCYVAVPKSLLTAIPDLACAIVFFDGEKKQKFELGRLAIVKPVAIQDIHVIFCFENCRNCTSLNCNPLGKHQLILQLQSDTACQTAEGSPIQFEVVP